MPRKQKDVYPESDKHWKVNDLTYENRHEELLGHADEGYESPCRIMLCVMGGVHTGPVKSWSSNRDAIAEKLKETYGTYTKESDASKRLCCPENSNHAYLELEPLDSLDTFFPFEQFLEKHIRLWSYMAVVYYYGRTARANALVYQRATDEPIHPASPLFSMSEYEDIFENAAYAEWKEYHRQKDDDAIEYKYRPQYVINGDIDMNGLDTRAFIMEHCRVADERPLDIRFKAHPDVQPYTEYPPGGPLDGDSQPLIDANSRPYTIKECKRVTNYPDHLEYQEIQEEYRSVDIIGGTKEYRECIP